MFQHDLFFLHWGFNLLKLAFIDSKQRPARRPFGTESLLVNVSLKKVKLCPVYDFTISWKTSRKEESILYNGNRHRDAVSPNSGEKMLVRHGATSRVIFSKWKSGLKDWFSCWTWLCTFGIVIFSGQFYSLNWDLEKSGDMSVSIILWRHPSNCRDHMPHEGTTCFTKVKRPERRGQQNGLVHEWTSDPNESLNNSLYQLGISMATSKVRAAAGAAFYANICISLTMFSAGIYKLLHKQSQW